MSVEEIEDIDKLHARIFCDCVNMGQIAAQLTFNVKGETDGENVLCFAVLHLADMLRDLKKRYPAGLARRCAGRVTQLAESWAPSR
jgi:hypothetical protein